MRSRVRGSRIELVHQASRFFREETIEDVLSDRFSIAKKWIPEACSSGSYQPNRALSESLIDCDLGRPVVELD